MAFRRAARLIAPIGLAGLGACAPPAGEERPLVVVSVPPQAWVVERLAGDLVTVEVMVPPSARHATWEPTLAQLRALSRASLYVEVGHPAFPFERNWLERVLAEHPGVRVVDGSLGRADPSGDPHLWLVPRHVRALADELAAALAALHPAHAGEIEANRARLAVEIEALDAELRERLRGARGHRFLVFHPAFGHFAAEYGLRQLAIEREGKEPDARALAERIAEARAAGVKVVFVQPQYDPATARVVAGEIGARLETLDPMARDWPANLRRTAALLAEAARP